MTLNGMSQNIGNIFVNILRCILELQVLLYYRVTRIIVNDFESENLYVINFTNRHFISFDRYDL